MDVRISISMTPRPERISDWTWVWWKWWFFHFSRYTYVKGFKLRICGIYFNIREGNATMKLIHITREQERQKKLAK